MPDFAPAGFHITPKKEKMRQPILLVILQLAVLLIETYGDFTFGDIIAIKRFPTNKKGLFKHYAIYVGNEPFEGKKPEHDIFEFKGTVGEWIMGPAKGKDAPIANCLFSTLDMKAKPFVDNYLDNLKGYKVGTKDEIKKWTEEKYRDCGPYKPKKNNCEHLATYVRYGVRVSIQHGTKLEGKAKNDPNINVKEILEKIDPNDDSR